MKSFRTVELLARASASAGCDVRLHVLRHAVKVGAVDRPENRSGWSRWSQRHYEQFVRYLRERSRVVLRVS